MCENPKFYEEPESDWQHFYNDLASQLNDRNICDPQDERLEQFLHDYLNENRGEVGSYIEDYEHYLEGSIQVIKTIAGRRGLWEGLICFSQTHFMKYAGKTNRQVNPPGIFSLN
jgi:hypothetical protein